jgi:hypothetical protein
MAVVPDADLSRHPDRVRAGLARQFARGHQVRRLTQARWWSGP